MTTAVAGVGRYVGIPFVPGGSSWAGCDCWGIVQLYYRNEHGIELARVAEYPPAPERMKLVLDNYAALGFETIPIDSDRYIPGDVLLLQHAAIPDNFAVVVEGARFLTAAPRIGSMTASVINDRVVAAFRWSGVVA